MNSQESKYIMSLIAKYQKEVDSFYNHPDYNEEYFEQIQYDPIAESIFASHESRVQTLEGVIKDLKEVLPPERTDSFEINNDSIADEDLY